MENRGKAGLSSEIRMLLKNCSASELDELLTDQRAFYDFVRTLPCVMGLEKSVEMMSEETEKLAGKAEVPCAQKHHSIAQRYVKSGLMVFTNNPLSSQLKTLGKKQLWRRKGGT
jgi:hypothetical protein